MKQIITFFLAFVVLSCQPKKIQSIEVMAYYYDFDSKKNWVIKPFLYSYVEGNGEAKCILKNNDNTAQVGFETKIDKDILKDILLKSISKDDVYYLHKKNSSNSYLYCGPIIRYKINYGNNHILTLTIQDKKYDSSSKYFPFKKMYDVIPIAKKENKANKKVYNLDLQISQYMIYCKQKDSLSHEFPLPPNPSEKIKFIAH